MHELLMYIFYGWTFKHHNDTLGLYYQFWKNICHVAKHKQASKQTNKS